MLYDPKWEIKTDILDLGKMIAWLETKDPTEPYCYTSSGHCLIAQYLIAHGFANPNVESVGGWDSRHPSCQKKSRSSHIARGHPLDETSRTFGAALHRARAVAALR